MRLDWQSTLPGPAYDAIRDRLALHLNALLATPLPTITLDGNLVERARAVFGRASPAARVYGRIRRSPQAAAVPSWRPRDAMGPLGAVLFRTALGPDAGGWRTRLLHARRVLRRVSNCPGAGDPGRGGRELGHWREDRHDGAIQQDWPPWRRRWTRSTRRISWRPWDALLDDLQLVPLRSVSQAAQDLYALSSQRSPIRDLLAGVVRQVTLPPTSGPSRSIAGPQPAAVIAAHYRTLQDLVGAGPGAPIDQALRSLTDVQQMLAKMAASPINSPAVTSGTADPVATLRTDAQRWPNPLRRWFMTIADSTAAFRGPATPR